MWIDDLVLQQAEQPLVVSIWVPDTPCVVLGNANDFARECKTVECINDEVTVLKRYGGGGAVVLHPGCLIISVGMWVNQYFGNQNFFSIINEAVINTLQGSYPNLNKLGQNGISDITWRERKIAGTSLFRSRNYLLYQASLLVEDNINLIERYLAHPSKEPEYRNGKSHRDFLCSLSEVLGKGSMLELKRILESHLHLQLTKSLQEYWISPPPEQITYLLKKCGKFVT